ncbi:DegT/DnrJ/EryC1/StrS family aminotransferase [Nocardia sp. NPDC050435]|uniref:DegT/DnrJ/EryC1/StrS family aminotransferase n=1 Tax=Nocardia sp. NPDC050435 TaxID=3155040 RepID=UPI0033C10980
MKIPRYHYPAQFPDLPTVSTAMTTALREGDYILGATVEHFENRFAAYIGTRYAVGVNSGTDALVLALSALGIGPGDEVITVANTFHATVLAIHTVGATPVLVDCVHGSYLMDLDACRSACGPRTAAILAVHLFGQALNMQQLGEIADRASVPIIEDCAQSVGGTWAGRRLGSFGVASAVSFHPSKNLAAAGDAGAVITDNPTLAERIRILRNLGQDGQNHHVLHGYNSKLDALQALILDAKLDHLDTWNHQRRSAADDYRRQLADLDTVLVHSHPEPPGDHIYHLLQMTVPEPGRRDAVLDRLRQDGVDAVVRYPTPIHQQPSFTTHSDERFPVAEYQAGQTLCLPIRPDLRAEEISYVTECVRAATCE